MQKVVLIIEDNFLTHETYKRGLGSHLQISIISARSLEEGYEFFIKAPHIDIIVMDGCIDNAARLDSLPLIKKIRETYSGIMIAASSESEYMNQMKEAGCDYMSTKSGVPRLILKLLELD